MYYKYAFTVHILVNLILIRFINGFSRYWATFNLIITKWQDDYWLHHNNQLPNIQQSSNKP